MATAYLKENGFAVLARNWRHKRLEIDIIAEKDGKLYFTEVKTRSSDRFGFPEKAIGPTKMANMKRAAEAFMDHAGLDGPIQFDVVAVTLSGGGHDIFHIKDVFF